MLKLSSLFRTEIEACGLLDDDDSAKPRDIVSNLGSRSR